MTTVMERVEKYYNTGMEALSKGDDSTALMWFHRSVEILKDNDRERDKYAKVFFRLSRMYLQIKKMQLALRYAEQVNPRFLDPSEAKVFPEYLSKLVGEPDYTAFLNVMRRNAEFKKLVESDQLYIAAILHFTTEGSMKKRIDEVVKKYERIDVNINSDVLLGEIKAVWWLEKLDKKDLQ